MAQAFEFEKNNIPVYDLVITNADFVEGVWSSDSVTVGNFSACQINVDYKNVSPDSDDLLAGESINYRVRARLETEVATGRWHTLVTQIEGLQSTVDVASERVLISDPTQLILNPESEIFDGINQSTSTTNKHIGGKIRLCLVLEDLKRAGGMAFNSATVSADGLLF